MWGIEFSQLNEASNAIGTFHHFKNIDTWHLFVPLTPYRRMYASSLFTCWLQKDNFKNALWHIVGWKDLTWIQRRNSNILYIESLKDYPERKAEYKMSVWWDCFQSYLGYFARVLQANATLYLDDRFM